MLLIHCTNSSTHAGVSTQCELQHVPCAHRYDWTTRGRIHTELHGGATSVACIYKLWCTSIYHHHLLLPLLLSTYSLIHIGRRALADWRLCAAPRRFPLPERRARLQFGFANMNRRPCSTRLLRANLRPSKFARTSAAVPRVRHGCNRRWLSASMPAPPFDFVLKYGWTVCKTGKQH